MIGRDDAEGSIATALTSTVLARAVAGGGKVPGMTPKKRKKRLLRAGPLSCGVGGGGGGGREGGGWDGGGG